MTWLLIGGALKRGATIALSWLSHRSFWQLVCMALAGFALLQHFQLADARHDRDAYLKQRDGYRAKLEAISTVKNEQKAETAERIEVVTRTIHDADGKAKVIESAPLPGNCKTPAEVSQADL